MKVMTERDLILKVAENWAKQYKRKDIPIAEDKAQILDQLEALDKEKCSSDDVASIIKNRSWTRLSCNECDQETTWILLVGEESDYESRTAALCKECLKKAANYL